MAGRVRAMRELAEELMTVLEEFDPFLIGSTLSGQIRESSDVDLHVYCDHYEEVRGRLAAAGYEGVEVEFVENVKGDFVHLRWVEEGAGGDRSAFDVQRSTLEREEGDDAEGACGIPVEITVHSWEQRGEVFYSSVTGKVMKRVDLVGVRRLVGKG